MEKYTYLVLDLFALLPVLVLSFDKWVRFKNKWESAFIAILPIAFVFVVWDVWFTAIGVWEFNPKYLLGPHFFGLPLEEYLFFIAIPWVCLFLYEVFLFHFSNLVNRLRLSLYPSIISIGSIVMLIFSSGLYTLVNCSLSLLLSILLFKVWNKKQRSDFSLIYIVHLLPFAIVNGVLTAKPVVIYNNTENVGIRFFTIPLEDFFYSFNLLALCFMIYFVIERKKITN